MMEPEKIKKGNVCCGSGSCDGCPYRHAENDNNTCCEVLTEDTLTYIQQLETQVPKWISVEEQPEPPEDDVYWCYGYWIGSGRMQAETAEYLCGEWKIANNFVLTHWMPLPEPPKEDAHG